MPRTTTDLIFNVTGQSLTHLVRQGRPTSATFKVFRDYSNDDATPEFSGSATVDSVNTTVDVASGQAQTDPNKISLTSTTGIVIGTKYLIAENSKQEWVDPIEIVSADYIRVRHPLRNNYTTAATFVGTTLSAAVDSTWIALTNSISDHDDPNPDYRIRWEILVGGATVVEYSYCDVVRGRVSYSCDIDDVNARAPGLVDSLPREYQEEQGRPLLDSAWRAVQSKLAAMNLDADAVRDAQALDELVIMKSLHLLAMGGWKPLGLSSIEYVEMTRTDFERFFEQHWQTNRSHAIATGPSSAADTSAPKQRDPYWAK